MYNYVYTTIYTDIHIDKYFNDTCWIPNQGHGHEEFLQGAGSWVVVTVGARNRNPRWYKTNHTLDL
jgi:hypothetical protein